MRCTARSKLAAQAELAEAVEWFEGHREDEGMAGALVGLGIATAPFDPDRARALMLESARLFGAIGDAWGEAIVLGALGWLDVGRGDYTEEDRFERAYSLARYVDDEVATAHAATNLIELRLTQGRPDEARDLLSLALKAYEALHLYDGMSYALEAASRLASSVGSSEEAARLLGAADGLRTEVGVPVWGARLTRFESLVDSARVLLGSDAFDSIWTSAQGLGFEGSLAAARQLVRQIAAGRPQSQWADRATSPGSRM